MYVMMLVSKYCGNLSPGHNETILYFGQVFYYKICDLTESYSKKYFIKRTIENLKRRG